MSPLQERSQIAIGTFAQQGVDPKQDPALMPIQDPQSIHDGGNLHDLIGQIGEHVCPRGGAPGRRRYQLDQSLTDPEGRVA
jgi:hypothetical protein